MGSIIRGWWRGLTCTSAAEEEVWPLTTQSTLQNEWGGGGKVEAHSNTYRYSQLPGSAAFPWSVLLCSSNVICPSLVCADHFHTKNLLGNAISWSALPLVFISLIPVRWYTSYLSAHPPESPYQVMCSHCSYHCIFHAMPTYAHWLPHCPRRLHGLSLCWEQSRTAQ